MDNNFTEQTNEIALKAQDFEIATHEKADAAGEFLKQVNKLENSIKEFFKPMKKSADDHKRQILKQERETLEPVQNAKAEIKKKLLAFHTEQERIRKEKEKKLREEAEKAALKEAEETGKEVVLDNYVAPIIPTPKKNFQTITYYSVEIISKKDLPLEYLEPNMTALNAVARAMKDGFNIPGAKLVKTKSVR